jgi:hypothetical protein
MAGYVYRRAQAKGLLGGSKAWSVLWGLLFARRLLKRFTEDKPEILFRHELEPNETIVIREGERPVRVVGGEPA